MIAGPNGSGKTTIAQELITNSSVFYEFINADEIAKGLAPLHSESMALAASKLMVNRLKELLDGNKSFAFETTAAGTNYIKHLNIAKSKGYEISCIFLWLASPEQAMARVAERVKQGGHNISKESIIRRYHTGLRNFFVRYMPIIDKALIMDNSSEESSERIIARKIKGFGLNILNQVIWKKIEEIAYGR